MWGLSTWVTSIFWCATAFIPIDPISFARRSETSVTTRPDGAKTAASRLTLELALRTYTRRDLEAVQAAGERLRIRVLGLATIADDVSPDLARATIESIVVLGALHAPADVR